MVLFRDWLRTHDDERDLYLATKRELAAREWRYVQHYADAKTAVVEGIIARPSRSERDEATYHEREAITGAATTGRGRCSARNCGSC